MDALRGPERDQALADLRSLLVRGLRYALADRFSATDTHADTRYPIEDFAQEALIKILDGLDSFRGESRFTTWAQKIAIHTAFSELRRQRWKDISLQDLISRYSDGNLTPALLIDPASSPEKQAAQRLVMETLQRLIAEELTERQREALTAVMIGGMPTAEVARRMGTNRNALYKLLHDARQRLKKRIMAQGLSFEDMLAAFEP